MDTTPLSTTIRSVVQELLKTYHNRDMGEDRHDVDEAFRIALNKRGVQLPDFYAHLLILSYEKFALVGIKVQGVVQGEFIDVSEREHIELPAPQ